MEKREEYPKPVIISEERKRVLNDDERFIHVSLSEADSFDWPDDISRDWILAESEHEGYRKYTEVLDSDDDEQHVVYHRRDKELWAGNFLKSDINRHEKGKKLAVVAASIAAALAASGAAAYLYVHNKNIHNKKKP